MILQPVVPEFKYDDSDTYYNNFRRWWNADNTEKELLRIQHEKYNEGVAKEKFYSMWGWKNPEEAKISVMQSC